MTSAADVQLPRSHSVDLLDSILKPLVGRAPGLDFRIYVDPEGSGITITNLSGDQPVCDVRHPTFVGAAIQQAWREAMSGGSAVPEREGSTQVGDLEATMRLAINWLPDHLFWVGREGDEVFGVASITGYIEPGRVFLPAKHFSLADALMLAVAREWFRMERERSYPFGLSEKRAAA